MKPDLPITFCCPHCEATLGASRRIAGKQARCPECQKQIDVPEEAKSTAGSGSRRGSS